jgi:hypothetical protein
MKKVTGNGYIPLIGPKLYMVHFEYIFCKIFNVILIVSLARSLYLELVSTPWSSIKKALLLPISSYKTF